MSKTKSLSFGVFGTQQYLWVKIAVVHEKAHNIRNHENKFTMYYVVGRVVRQESMRFETKETRRTISYAM